MTQRLKTREVLELLNISSKKLRNLERDGLLVPVEKNPRSKYFDKDDVMAYLNKFGTKRLKTREVLELLNISSKKLLNLERDGLLVPVEKTSGSKYFNEDDVEAYLKSEQQRLKAREVLEILNIGEEKLRNLERNGLLVPIKKTNCSKIFNKDDVMTYLNKFGKKRLKTREVLELLNISRQKLQKIERDGLLVPVEKTSRTKYFNEDDVMIYLNESERKAKNNIETEVNVWKMRLPHSYQKFVRQLVLDKQHVKNNIILFREKLRKLYPDESYQYDVTDFVYMRKILSQLNGCSTEEMKPIIESDPLLTIIDNDLTLTDHFVALLDFYTKYNNQILVDIIKEVSTSYANAFEAVQSGRIKSFEMKPKKLSKLKRGSIDINSNNVKWRKQHSQLELSIYTQVYKKKHGFKNTFIYFPKEKVLQNGAELANVNLVLRGSGDVDVCIIYKTPQEPSTISRPYSLGIDPGVKNHLTLASNNPDARPLLLRSRAVNKINKLADYVKTKVPSGDYRLSLINERRRIILDNELNKLSSRIIDYCKLYRIGTIYFGRNLNMKNNQKKRGKKFNKRNFAFPHYQLYLNLRYKAERAGITVVSQEESYTSKFNCMDLTNELWKYDYRHNRPTESVRKKQGLRGQRDLFALPNSKVKINADVNGAYNIMWKGLRTVQEISLTQATSPLLIRDDFQFLDYLTGCPAR